MGHTIGRPNKLIFDTLTTGYKIRQSYFNVGTFKTIFEWKIQAAADTHQRFFLADVLMPIRSVADTTFCSRYILQLVRFEVFFFVAERFCSLHVL